MRAILTPFSLSLQLAAAALANPAPAAAQSAGPDHVSIVTAVTEVFATGQRLTAAVLQYDLEIDADSLETASFEVEGRTVSDVYASAVGEPQPKSSPRRGDDGRYVVVELSPEDPAAALVSRAGAQSEPSVAVVQTRPIKTSFGDVYEPSPQAMESNLVKNLVVDDFDQMIFSDPETGVSLAYNLYRPKLYDPSTSYPLVLFLHDSDSAGDAAETVLAQGLGAVVWASPQDLLERPAFVLAPQYPAATGGDDPDAARLLDATVNLVEKLVDDFRMDRSRLYATGQADGAAKAAAIVAKHPDLFAASFLVADDWDPAEIEPLADQKAWIMLSESDADKRAEQVAERLEQAGATVNREEWDGAASPEELEISAEAMAAKGGGINLVVLKANKARPGRIEAKRVAYSIPRVRDWMFKQRKDRNGDRPVAE